MTMFNIAYNSIPRDSLITTPSSEDSDYPHENLFHGSSTIYWKTAAAVTSSNIVFDLGSGNSAAVEYAILHGLRPLLASTPGTVGVQVRASTDNFSGSDDLILSDSNVQIADLVGPHADTLVLTDTVSSAYRYWKLVITTTNSVKHILNKFYLGEFFNFSNRAPRYPYTPGLNTGNSRGFIADAGTVFSTSSGRPREERLLVWHGIPDSVLNTFTTQIRRYLSDFPLFLYTPDSFTHNPLPDNILFGWASVEVESGEQWLNTNIVTMNFIEDIIR